MAWRIRLAGAFFLAAVPMSASVAWAQTIPPILRTPPDPPGRAPADSTPMPVPLPPGVRPDTPGGVTSGGVARPPAVDAGIVKSTPSADSFPMPVITPPGSVAPAPSPSVSKPGAPPPGPVAPDTPMTPK